MVIGVGCCASLYGQAITEFPLAHKGAYPASILIGPDRNVWIADGYGVERISVTGEATAFRVFSEAVISTTSFVLGPDENFWFTRTFANVGRPYPQFNTVGRMSPDGNLKEVQLADFSYPADITIGPDGNLWFTESGGGKVARITPSFYLSEFETTGKPTIIRTGSDRNLWFTEQYGDNIGRVSLTGQVTEFPLPRKQVQPLTIVAGPDGNMWFTEFTGESIGRITPSGEVTEFKLSIPTYEPSEIIVGPDGNLWFTEGNWYTAQDAQVSGGIGRITPSGVITEFPLPSTGRPPGSLITGPDGNLWFTEPGFNAPGRTIGRITPEGVITEFETPDSNGWPHAMVAGPDGNVWFAENEVGRITTDVGLQVPVLAPRPNNRRALDPRPGF